MTIDRFRNILRENGVNPDDVKINDTVTDGVYYINEVYDFYDVGFRERGILTHEKRFTNRDDAFHYVFELLGIHSYLAGSKPQKKNVVFLGKPPADADLFETKAKFYYLNKNKAFWSPNGETEWKGHEITGIDSVEEAQRQD